MTVRFLPISYAESSSIAVATTGELLKVGQTTSSKFVGRFEKYVTAGNKTGKRITIDAFEVPLAQRGMVEGQIGGNVGAAPGTLPWDNSGRRLGRPGGGVPDGPIPTRWSVQQKL